VAQARGAGAEPLVSPHFNHCPKQTVSDKNAAVKSFRNVTVTYGAVGADVVVDVKAHSGHSRWLLVTRIARLMGMLMVAKDLQTVAKCSLIADGDPRFCEAD